MWASDSVVKHAGSDCFPIKEVALGKKIAKRKDNCDSISCLCNSANRKQCISRLRVKLLPYLSPKGKYKNVLIFFWSSQQLQKQTDFCCRQIKNKEWSTYKGLCNIHQTERVPPQPRITFHSPPSSSPSHKIWRKLFLAFFGIPLLLPVLIFFFLIHTVSELVLP